MLKPLQVSLRAQLSEHSSSKDDDVSFAWSNAHLTGPFCVVIDFLNDTTFAETFRAVTGIIIPNSSSGTNTGIDFECIF